MVRPNSYGSGGAIQLQDLLAFITGMPGVIWCAAKLPVMKLVLHLPGDPNHWYAAARSSTPRGLPKLLLLWFCIGGVCVGFEIPLCNPVLVSGRWLSKTQK